MNQLEESNFLLALKFFIHSIKNKGERKSFFYQDEKFFISMQKELKMIDSKAVDVLTIKEIAFKDFCNLPSFGDVLGVIDHANPWYATICENVERQATKLFLLVVGYEQIEKSNNFVKLTPTKKHDSVNLNNKNHTQKVEE